MLDGYVHVQAELVYEVLLIYKLGSLTTLIYTNATSRRQLIDVNNFKQQQLPVLPASE